LDWGINGCRPDSLLNPE